MKTISEKLGCKGGMVGWAYNRPAELQQAVPFGAAAKGRPDVIIAFVASVAEVPTALRAVQEQYERGKHLWFAYPKKTGSIKSDITRDHGWQPMVAQDLLPVTQIAIDETWSALRFRYRDEIVRLTRKSDMPGKK